MVTLVVPTLKLGHLMRKCIKSLAQCLARSRVQCKAAFNIIIIMNSFTQQAFPVHLLYLSYYARAIGLSAAIRCYPLPAGAYAWGQTHMRKSLHLSIDTGDPVQSDT